MAGSATKVDASCERSCRNRLTAVCLRGFLALGDTDVRRNERRRGARIVTLAVGTRAWVSIAGPARLTPLDLRYPDLTVLKDNERAYRGTLPSAADVLFLIEIAVTTLAEDRADKIPLYARAGVRESWIVDVSGAAIEVYRDAQGRCLPLRPSLRADRAREPAGHPRPHAVLRAHPRLAPTRSPARLRCLTSRRPPHQRSALPLPG
jgi:hypothetical protein